jgi:hypothetical protein
MVERRGRANHDDFVDVTVVEGAVRRGPGHGGRYADEQIFS